MTRSRKFDIEGTAWAIGVGLFIVWIALIVTYPAHTLRQQLEQCRDEHTQRLPSQNAKPPTPLE